MNVTGLSHAGLLIETAGGTVLCDPWVNPAFFGSWYPFPSNSELNWDQIGRCDYLYISHLHRDHFDSKLLSSYVDKTAIVLLPDYPTTELEDSLRDLGFTSFVRTVAGEIHRLDGFDVAIDPLVSPSDGPIGDSALWLEADGVRIYNQNDARPPSLNNVRQRGQVDAHFLQFSGANWFPMAYDFPDAEKSEFASRKRSRGFDRSARYIDELQAAHVFPNAGPPCFLDDDLWHLNDLDGTHDNTFPDQQAFRQYCASRGMRQIHTLYPGDTVTLREGTLTTRLGARTHPDPFLEKEAYLHVYQKQQIKVIQRERAAWKDVVVAGSLVPTLARLFEPILAEAEQISSGIGATVLLEIALADSSEMMVLDFTKREVRFPRGAERFPFAFRFDSRMLAVLLEHNEVDWVNSLLLSFRFSAHRSGTYNEYLYSFFKCLSSERVQYAEGWLAEQRDRPPLVRIKGWLVQARCPHLKADLLHFGSIDGSVLTCQMHGWRFDLDNGSCLTSSNPRHTIEAHRYAAVDDE